MLYVDMFLAKFKSMMKTILNLDVFLAEMEMYYVTCKCITLPYYLVFKISKFLTVSYYNERCCAISS